ncbi:MAG TPA: hypothetical protein PKK26_19215 [Candidatus Wallbacteria bacterium]|nr:hypothetical protein [Candidatus Wallbacteria bacterium]
MPLTPENIVSFIEDLDENDSEILFRELARTAPDYNCKTFVEEARKRGKLTAIPGAAD